MAFALGKKAFGFCDRCGFRRKLTRLYEETQRGKPMGNRVCRECRDIDHEQNFLGDATRYVDSQALRWARPDLSLDNADPDKNSRNMFSWSPVGANLFALEVKLGRVTVTTS